MGQLYLPSKMAPKRFDYRVTANDLNSVPQFLADFLFITILSVITGIGFHEVVHATQGPVMAFVLTGSIVAIFFGWIAQIFVKQRGASQTTTFDRIKGVCEAWTLAIAVFVFLLFTLKEAGGVSRGAVLSLYLVGMPLVAAWRVFSPLAVGRIARKAGVKLRASIVIGDIGDPLLDKFAAGLQANNLPSPMVFKFRASCQTSLWPAEVKRLAAQVADAARGIGQGEIYICTGAIPPDRLAIIERTLAVIPRAIFVVPDALMSSLVRCRPVAIGSHIVLEVRREPLGPVQRLLKRLMDIVAASLALAFLAPLFALIGLLIKLDSRGPVFFRQTRNGYQGRPFKIWKFRSMRVQEDGPVIKQAQRDDPRITRLGRFLRKSSIDELPQLLNILFGDMSLVGPRPHAQAHDELYARSIENYEIRQHVKPGLTGWAQVNGLRGETATIDLMHRRIEYDLWYAGNSSLLLDIEILARTVLEVIKQKNAY